MTLLNFFCKLKLAPKENFLISASDRGSENSFKPIFPPAKRGKTRASAEGRVVCGTTQPAVPNRPNCHGKLTQDMLYCQKDGIYCLFHEIFTVCAIYPLTSVQFVFVDGCFDKIEFALYNISTYSWCSSKVCLQTEYIGICNSTYNILLRQNYY